LRTEPVGLKTEEVTVESRKLQSAELHNLYFSPTNIRAIKSRKLKWAWHVARKGQMRRIQTFNWRTWKEHITWEYYKQIGG